MKKKMIILTMVLTLLIGGVSAVNNEVITVAGDEDMPVYIGD